MVYLWFRGAEHKGFARLDARKGGDFACGQVGRVSHLVEVCVECCFGAFNCGAVGDCERAAKSVVVSVSIVLDNRLGT